MKLPSTPSTFLSLLAITSLVSAAPESDRVERLPLFGVPPTPHYSGYLDATKGCDTSTNGDFCKIHYWLALAEGDWRTKPVVLWLNGGPGSSSILGFLQENGPLLINATGGLMENPYSWTKAANLFAIESPIGVGYSYCEAQVNGEVCENTDKYTATASRAALVDFFYKFPEFRANDFFITGESYAGVYIPTLAYEVLKYNAQTVPEKAINLKGLAVGDPCTDNDSQRESMDALWYAHKYGLVDDAVYDVLTKQCNVKIPNYLMLLPKSEELIASYLETTAKKSKPECTLAIRKYLFSTSHGVSGKWPDAFIDRFSLFAPVTDAMDIALEDYMSRPDVKAALHVQQAPISNWTKHADRTTFRYAKQYNACNHFADDNALSMIDFYRKIIPQLAAVWIYNGDTDPAVSYEGTRTAVKRIGFAEIDGGGYRAWFYNHTAASLAVIQEKSAMFGPDLLLVDTGAQFGGEVVNYENNLAFLTVHGSGHLVPQFRPQAALHMLSKFVEFADLSPLLPTNASLSSMTNHEFTSIMDKWTESAKTAPYVKDAVGKMDYPFGQRKYGENK